MEKVYTTMDVAKVLGMRPDKLQREIWLGKVRRPEKISNRYLWTIEDIERASWALHCSDRFIAWQKGGTNG